MLNHENKILMNIDKKFKGNVIPVVTPFTFEHKLDFDALERLFYHLTYHKASPFILGTTGESASLSVDIKNTYKRQASLSRQVRFCTLVFHPTVWKSR
jgi:hypothetical protein